MNNLKKFVSVALGAAMLFLCVGIVSSCSPQAKKTNTPLRGNIYDCNSNIIATNHTEYDIHMDCCTVSDDAMWEEKSRKLANEIAVILPHKSATQWREYFNDAREKEKRYVPIVKSVNAKMVDSLRSLTLFKEHPHKGGFVCVAKQGRTYPYGNIARRTIGVKSEGTGMGVFGIEGAYDKQLQHSDIYTTLDMNMQCAADSLLREVVENDNDIMGGCVAIMDVESGELKAVVNIHKNNNGDTGEYFNYFLTYGYEPGNIAHPMTLAAAMQDGITTQYKGEKELSAEEIGKIALNYSAHPDKFINHIKNFCIDESEFDIKGIRNVDMYPSTGINNEDLASIGKGFQYFVTPFHILAFYNSIANGGTLINPTIVGKISAMGEDTQAQTTPTVLDKEFLLPHVADSLSKFLALSNSENCKGIVGRKGTVRVIVNSNFNENNRSPYIDHIGRRQFASTFAGFYPQSDPKYSIVCAIFSKPTDKAGFSSNIPYEVAKKISER